jgi:oligopeptide transport system permease protein
MASASIEQVLSARASKQHSLWSDAWRRLAHNKVALAALGVIAFFTLAAIFADQLTPWPIDFQSRARANRGNGGVLLPPAWVQTGDPLSSGRAGFWLGTDDLGHDMLSRLIFGARVSIASGFVPMLLTLLVGSCIGLLAGYRGGWVDTLLMRLIDALYAFPDLLFTIIVIMALRDTAVADLMGGFVMIVVALSLLSWIGVARLVRGQVLSLREKEFVTAARAVGVPGWRIMLVHLLPNVLGPLIVTGTLAVRGYILAGATLEFLGIGVRPPTPTWGGMITDALPYLISAPHMLWIPASCLLLITFAFNFLGDALVDALDPRLR